MDWRFCWPTIIIIKEYNPLSLLCQIQCIEIQEKGARGRSTFYEDYYHMMRFLLKKVKGETSAVAFIMMWMSFFVFPEKAYAEDEYEEGFLTAYLNQGLERAVSRPDTVDKPIKHVGRDLNGWASTPVFGGYIIGQYIYSDKKGDHGGEGFGIRLARAYVSGTVLRDFKYRIQMELRNTPSLRDATIEWVRFKEFSVKGGQFKRGFTYENPTNPWDVGVDSYSQVVNRFAGFGDHVGEPSMNGRDRGIQFYGDLFPVGRSRFSLFHYEIGVFNGNGINRADNNRRKDVIGMAQLQVLPGWTFAFFGWNGTYTDGVTVDRKRWALSTRYQKNGWMMRAEYVHHSGYRIKDYVEETNSWTGTGKADGWYALVGVPVTRWFTPSVRYDVYREQGTWSSMKSIYTMCASFRLHKNLMFQLQYDYVDDRNADSRHNELRAAAYIRF